MAEGNGENLQALPLLEQDAGNQIVPVEQQYKHHNVVCLIKNKNGVSGTGFIGFYPQTVSRYLLTCHCVLPGGGGNKETIGWAESIFEFKTDKINSVLFKGYELFDMDHFESYTSPGKITEDEYGMNYTMIKVRDDVLTDYEPFELTDEYGVAKGYNVTIIQYDGKKLSTSNHRCSNKVGFLVFYGGHTKLGSSGAPVVRAINEKYHVVAIHCGGDTLKYGTLLSEIIYHVQNNGEIKPGSKTTLRMVDDFKNPPEKFSLFISYTHKDNTNEFAQRLQGDLELQGWEVRIDTEFMGPGDELSGKIATAIHDCNGMIVILTKNYKESKWCPKEVNLADSKDKKLYVLDREKIADDAKPSSIDLHINTSQLLHCSFCEDDQYDESLKQLIKFLRKDAENLGYS